MKLLFSQRAASSLLLVRNVSELRDIARGSSLNYVSIFEGGRGRKMLTDAYLGGGGCIQNAYVSILRENLIKLGKKLYSIFCFVSFLSE